MIKLIFGLAQKIIAHFRCTNIIFVDYITFIFVKVGEADEPSKLAFDALFQSPEDAVPIEQSE